jgi:hypothetical protein
MFSGRAPGPAVPAGPLPRDSDAIEFARDVAIGERHTIGRGGDVIGRVVIGLDVFVETGANVGGRSALLVLNDVERLAGRIVQEGGELAFPEVGRRGGGDARSGGDVHAKEGK